LKKLKPEDRRRICGDFYDTINDNINFFLKDKSRKIVVQLENFKVGYEEFWHAIGAQGDLEKALKELEIRRNISGKKNFWRQIGLKR
jgi:hypothetical protein